MKLNDSSSLYLSGYDFNTSRFSLLFMLPCKRPWFWKITILFFVGIAPRAASILENRQFLYVINVLHLWKHSYLLGFEYQEYARTLSSEKCCRMHLASCQTDVCSLIFSLSDGVGPLLPPSPPPPPWKFAQQTCPNINYSNAGSEAVPRYFYWSSLLTNFFQYLTLGNLTLNRFSLPHAESVRGFHTLTNALGQIFQNSDFQHAHEAQNHAKLMVLTLAKLSEIVKPVWQKLCPNGRWQKDKPWFTTKHTKH